MHGAVRTQSSSDSVFVQMRTGRWRIMRSCLSDGEGGVGSSAATGMLNVAVRCVTVWKVKHRDTVRDTVKEDAIALTQTVSVDAMECVTERCYSGSESGSGEQMDGVCERQ